MEYILFQLLSEEILHSNAISMIAQPLLCTPFSGTKKFRDSNGIYSKVHETQNKILFTCDTELLFTCIVSAEMLKSTKKVEYIGVHHHEKCTQNDIRVVQLSAFLKRTALLSKDSGLLLFKKAVADQFKGVCLPPEYKAKILEQIRNMRKYNKSKQKKIQVNVILAFNIFFEAFLISNSFFS